MAPPPQLLFRSLPVMTPMSLLKFQSFSNLPKLGFSQQITLDWTKNDILNLIWYCWFSWDRKALESVFSFGCSLSLIYFVICKFDDIIKLLCNVSHLSTSTVVLYLTLNVGKCGGSLPAMCCFWWTVMNVVWNQGNIGKYSVFESIRTGYLTIATLFLHI